jgi:hypothetical protein
MDLFDINYEELWNDDMALMAVVQVLMNKYMAMCKHIL